MSSEKKGSPYKSCCCFSQECSLYKRFKKDVDEGDNDDGVNM